MKIYTMTATFGKLEHRTLTLTPGLNIIEAPNEWGKSTWCAFLVNMLYGIDTRARSTGTVLADKERYAPWSGSPMAGRIDLNWDGRDITIERRTKGRVIFGDFKAYETETGMDVPELNGANCGQLLLGVERSVFTRAGFLKLSDLPVTQDDSLRRRLNNLVTTGDESGAGDKLGQQLKDLKNKCRYNRSGLLPQAEAERDQLQNQLADLHSLKNQAEQIRHVQSQLEAKIAELENHGDALRYAASLEDARQVSEAQDASDQAKQRLTAMMDACQALPSQEDAMRKLSSAQNLQEEWMALQMEAQMLPPFPEKPAVPAHYQGIDAVAAAETDLARNASLESAKKKNSIIAAAVFFVFSAVLLASLFFMPELALAAGIAIPLAGIAALVISYLRTKRINKELLALYDRHPGISPDHWAADARDFTERMAAYQVQLESATQLRGDLDGRVTDLQARISALTGGTSLCECQNEWAKTVAAWDALGDARRDLQRAESHAKALRSMAKTAQPPKMPDNLTYTAEENQAILAEARLKQRELNVKLGQCQGQTDALGSEALIKARLDTLNRRITRLEDTYYALEMAQDALRDATNALQRRFAPRISKRAQDLFCSLTGGKYQRLTLGSDLSLSTSAEGEDTLRSTQWRSDGTADQQYLALRLAVAEELTPNAPLILDDALVRFDDERMKAALRILKEEAQSKQVILFTCQSREKTMEESL